MEAILNFEQNVHIPLQNKIDKKKSLKDKILLDYYRFFSGEEVDMLPYAYIEDDDAYDNLIKYNPDYYLFRDEVELIKNNHTKLKQCLSDVANIIEIGPGSDHSLDNKTLPIISYAQNLENYYAVDHSKNYLNNILNYIKNSTTGINVFPVKADFRNIKAKHIQNASGKNCLIFLGSTIGNFNINQQNNIITQISKFIKSQDSFIFSVDTNMDEELLLRTYSDVRTRNFLFKILKYFCKVYPNFLMYIDNFRVEIEWCSSKKAITTYFVSNKTHILYFPNYGMVNIQEGQKLSAVQSHKFDRNQICDLAKQNNFKILDILNNSDKMQMFICQRL